MSEDGKFKIVYRKISELKVADYNPRRISDAEMAKLRRSIREFGPVDPAIINADSTIVGGHKRIQAAELEGHKTYPCVMIDVDKAREKVLNLALNRISGTFDEVMLAAMVSELETQEREDAGFDPLEVERLLGRLEGAAGKKTVSFEVGGEKKHECPECGHKF